MDTDVVFAGQGPDFASGCPYLALSNDRSTRCLFSCPDHVCLADPRRPRRPDADTQETLCLTAGFGECPRFAAAGTSRRPTTDRTLKWIGLAMVGLSAFLFLPALADKIDGPQ